MFGPKKDIYEEMEKQFDEIFKKQDKIIQKQIAEIGRQGTHRGSAPDNRNRESPQ